MYPEERLDCTIMMIAVSRDGSLLHEAHTSMQGNRELVMTAVSTIKGRQYEFINTLSCASAELRSDREVVRAAVAAAGTNYQYASDRLRGDPEIAMLAVSRCGYALAAVPITLLLSDRELVRAALRDYGIACQYCPPELQRDQDLIEKVGIFGEFFWSPSPTKRSTKTPQTIRGKIGAKFRMKIRKIRETFVLRLF